MASNNNQKNNPNQPRRKRNKKPVKRYSEEYSNRPNPYTGYSADGNYHPDAKKHPMSEASAVQPSRDAEESRRMADAVWPPASAGYVPPTVNIPAPKWATAETVVNQQLPPQAKQSAQEPVSAPQPDGSPQTSDDSAFLYQTVAADEPAVSAEEQTEQTEKTVKADVPAPPPRRGGSHRRKHTDREAARKAKTAKMEAKKAALDKIAKGVAAHSVSEQMIDDISSMSDAIESMTKTEKKKPTEPGVNWDEFYDAAFPPRGTEEQKESGRKGKPKQRVDFGEELPSDDVMPIKPVVLGADEPLPYDRIAQETQEAHVARSTQETAPAAESRPLRPSDLIPVLDFDKRTSSAQPDTPDDMTDDVIEDVSAATIEEILHAVEREKQEAVDKASGIRKSAEFAVGAMAFDSDRSEDWHEITPPPSDESAAPAPSAEEDSASVLSQRLLESYMALENQGEEESSLPPSDAAEAEEEVVPQVDINTLLHTADDAPVSGEPSAPQEIVSDTAEESQPSSFDGQADDGVTELTVTQPSSAADVSPEPSVEVPDVVSVEIDISEIEDEIFAETEVIAPEDLDTAGEEAPVSGEDAVKEKLEKLVEAAELAEVLRQESEDTLPPEEQPDNIDIFSIPLPSDDLSVTPEAVTKADGEDEAIRPYQPREKAADGEKVFESILIVDDNQKVLDPAISKEQDDTLYLHAKGASENPTAVFKLPDGPIVLPTDFDDADFQEQWLDEDEDGDQTASRTKRARRRVSAFIGAVVIVFAALILVSVVKTVVTGFTNLGGTGEKKTEYTEFIAPVVLNDPAPFETIEKADNQMLLESAIWRVLDEMRKTEGYEYTYDATKKIVIAADQVEQAGRELFGSEVQLNMNVLSESDGSAIYYYDSIENTFHISEGGVMGPTAVITRMAQRSDHVSLIVGYISQEEMTLTSSEEEPECYKYMEYVLSLQPNGSYYIQSIRNYVEE